MVWANPDKFTYKIYYGGQILKKGNKKHYSGGEIVYLDCVFSGCQSLVECHNIANELRYKVKLSHYKKLQVGIFEEMVCDAQLTN
ncbi:hypothetical protein DVH24_001320 [Malus domestica]|uniref:Uncharacterized protein n=1 Tax=Malus domestica TaxID=3750 RepID=A0A498K0V8_MALDO|nr:hypothetical protein DVH24_001320 [Malus domestica]